MIWRRFTLPVASRRHARRQIAAALTHVRSSWGNAAPAVTAADVPKVRTATMGRPGPWTVADLNAARLQ